VSYRKKHIKSKINKIKPKKSILRRLWFWIVLLSLLIILFVFYFFLFYSGVQVKNILISGNQKVESKDIENLISDNINNKILGIGSWGINSKSIFLIHSDKLSRKILNKFPIIKSVKIDKKFMQTLVFEINERVPIAIFCPSLDKTDSEKGGCYFMDDSGIIFEPLYVMPQNMTIVRSRLSPNGEVADSRFGLLAESEQTIDVAQIFAGERVVQQNIMDLLSKIKKNLKDDFQINIEEALVTSPLRLNVNTNENWQIYFNLDTSPDINSQLTKLNLLLSGGITANERKNLQYIDLRYKDRAIICDNKTCGK